jgi:hypothetical protein
MLHLKQLSHAQLCNLAERLLKIEPERISALGEIRFYELPGDTNWTEENYRKYWPGLFADKHKRENMLAMETHNLLTTVGRAQILSYIGSTSGSSVGFAQYFSLGTGLANTLSPGDTTIATELFRVVPTTTTTTGNTIDIQSLIGSAQAVGVLSNAGLWGNGATTTLGTGSLLTHALINGFNKVNGAAYSADYDISLN